MFKHGVNHDVKFEEKLNGGSVLDKLHSLEIIIDLTCTVQSLTCFVFFNLGTCINRLA